MRDNQDIKKYLSTKINGDKIVITIIRDGTTMTKNLTLTEFSDDQLNLDNKREGLLDQNQPFNLPLIPNESFKDLLDSCYKMLDKDTCDILIPGR